MKYHISDEKINKKWTEFINNQKNWIPEDTPNLYLSPKKKELNEPLTFFYGKLNSFVAIHCYY